jgi:hypothetical protein
MQNAEVVIFINETKLKKWKELKWKGVVVNLLV